MKKKIALISLILVFSMVFTGCSFTDLFKKSDDSSSSLELTDYEDEGKIELGEYVGVAVDVSVSDDEVQAQVDDLIDQKTTYKQINKGKAKDGDTVNIDYVGTMNGEEFSGGTATGSAIELGSNSMIDGFESGIVGMKVGKSKTLNLKFPSDYQTTELAGKKVKFKVTLNFIQGDAIVPELTDSFIADNTDYKTITEYRDYVKSDLAQSKKEAAGKNGLSTVVEKTKVVEYPEEMLATIKEQCGKQIEAMLQMYGMDKSTYLTQYNMTEEEYDKQLLEVAQEETKAKMINETIAVLEDIEITQKEIDDKITETAQQSSSTAEDMRTYYKDNYGMDLDTYIRDQILEEKVCDFIGKNAALSETPLATSGSAVQ